MAVKGQKIIINIERCKGCGLCVLACKDNVLSMSKEMNKIGVHFVEFKDLKNCKSCTMCAIICPEAAIEVYKE